MLILQFIVNKLLLEELELTEGKQNEDTFWSDLTAIGHHIVFPDTVCSTVEHSLR